MIHWIHATYADSAEVLADQLLPDRHTGEPRQVDVLVRLTGGAVRSTLIGEVRDRSRKADARWIEEVASKVDSVRAQGGFVVSRAGFSAPALVKAREVGIQAFSFEDLDRERFDSWFSQSAVVALRWEAAVAVDCFDDTGEPLAPHERVLRGLERALAENARGVRAPHPHVLAVMLGAGVDAARAACKTRVADRVAGDVIEEEVSVALESPVEMPDNASRPRRLARAVVRLTLTARPHELPVVYSRYRDVAEDTTVCDVLEARVELGGEPFLVHMLGRSKGGVLPAGSPACVRIEPLTERGRGLLKGSSLDFVPRGPEREDGAIPADFYLRLQLEDEV